MTPDRIAALRDGKLGHGITWRAALNEALDALEVAEKVAEHRADSINEIHKRLDSCSADLAHVTQERDAARYDLSEALVGMDCWADELTRLEKLLAEAGRRKGEL